MLYCKGFIDLKVDYNILNLYNLLYFNKFLLCLLRI